MAKHIFLFQAHCQPVHLLVLCDHSQFHKNACHFPFCKYKIAIEFRDALAIQYRKPLLNIPSDCDGCGATLSLSHALSCRKRGLVIQRHNEIRDAFGDFAALVWNQVKKEPVVKEPS